MNVVNTIAENPKLLSLLQSQKIFLLNGETLRLHCALTAASKTNTIHWTFLSRFANLTEPITLATQKPNEIKFSNTNSEKNDGKYQCWFGNEYQVSEQKQQQHTKKVSLGFFVFFFVVVNVMGF